MTVRTSIDLTRRFSVQAPLAQVFALLSDVPASARHFPQLERLVDLGGGVYRWQMQKVGAPPVLMQITYDCLYVADADCGTVRWTPAGGTGSAGATEVSGHWQLTARNAATDLALAIRARMALPLPAFTTKLVAPRVEAEFARMVDQYIASLRQHFTGPLSPPPGPLPGGCA